MHQLTLFMLTQTFSDIDVLSKGSRLWQDLFLFWSLVSCYRTLHKYSLWHFYRYAESLCACNQGINSSFSFKSGSVQECCSFTHSKKDGGMRGCQLIYRFGRHKNAMYGLDVISDQIERDYVDIEQLRRMFPFVQKQSTLHFTGV